MQVPPLINRCDNDNSDTNEISNFVIIILSLYIILASRSLELFYGHMTVNLVIKKLNIIMIVIIIIYRDLVE